MDPFIGQIMLFAGNFAPRGWAFCNGQLLEIQTNSALFSLIGATYGGDGKKTFALPDLRGRAPVHFGKGPGLTDRKLGAKAGAETVSLTTDQMPKHSHTVKCSDERGDSNDPRDRFPARSRTNPTDNYKNDSDGTMNAGMIEGAGGGAAHDNMQPCLVLNYCIALVGTYPSRN